MAGQRGARSGRGWDAIPPRAASRKTEEPPIDGGLRRDAPGRGNAPARRPRHAGDGGLGHAQQSEPERAREICLRQLAVRPRTRVELAKALARGGISEEVIAEVLDRYDEVGIIDD